MSTNEVIARLDAAVSALLGVSVSAWSEESLRAQLGEVSVALCAIDSALARVADEVRAHGLRVEEPATAGVSSRT
ncbi:hypothetical protein [Micromonospora sp. LOL_021]|uniref:hypothetical protein n=1 Tax=Micromonospora sp. LOL_021 TaxID=3345417 RepID=UPI003A86ED7D